MGTSGEGGVGQAAEEASAQLIRGMGLGAATSLNMLDMIGVGPFITMPLIVSAMGGPQAMLGWILGAGFAVCDGLVWAELGAAMPGSGGSYRYLKEIYGPNGLGQSDFVPVHLATFLQRALVDCIGLHRGLADYAGYFWPRLGHVYFSHTASARIPLVGNLQISWLVNPGTAVAVGACLLAVFLLYRRITAIGRLSTIMWVVVMGTIGWIIVAGLTHFKPALAFDFPPGPLRFRGIFSTAWAAPC